MKEYASLMLRIGIGGLFLTIGIFSIISPAGVKEMLANLGFPIASFFAWLLILIELLCGAAVLVGWKIKWVTIPIALVLFVSMVISPLGGFAHPLKDAALLLATIALWLLGPGMWGMDRK